MTPEQRRQWLHNVLGCQDLTAAHKVVLVALETYADYRDGTNARPGEANLARVCALQVRAVRYALEAGQRLGFIERTGVHNSRVGRAAVYRLLAPPPDPTTGTAVPVDNPGDTSMTGTAMPVDRPTTGTVVPVDRFQDRHGQTARPAQPCHYDRHSGAAHPPGPSNTLQLKPLRKPGTALADCPDCHGTHWLTDGEGTPLGRCLHPSLQAVANG